MTCGKSASGAGYGNAVGMVALSLNPDFYLPFCPAHADWGHWCSPSDWLWTWKGSVSHDREFVSGLANRIIEVRTDGTLYDFGGNYEDFLASQGVQ
jgi:hypothetical protein